MESEILQRFERCVREDGRYPIEAYEFLHRGLDAATREVHGDDPVEGPRHVTGRQLCEALRRVALEQWGPLAQTVLARWNIHSTRDFGEMIYVLVRARIISKQDSDSIEDFDNVYEFREALRQYEIPLDALDE